MRKIQTSEQAADFAVSKIGAEIDRLSARRDNALSSFRRAADELSTVNEELEAKVRTGEELARVLSDHMAGAQKQIEDNTKVRERILEIIGE